MAKKPATDKSGLTAAAEAVGAAAGKIAALVGVTEPAPPAKVARKPKLEPKNRHRLPRREKKARQKAALNAATKDSGQGRV